MEFVLMMRLWNLTQEPKGKSVREIILPQMPYDCARLVIELPDGKLYHAAIVLPEQVKPYTVEGVYSYLMVNLWQKSIELDNKAKRITAEE